MKTVAIITRTLNREIFLKRLLYILLNQSFKDFTWIIVNDGGSQDPINLIIKEANSLGIDAKAIHHEKNLGMEAASNSGIKNSKSEYIVILDDDDSWDSRFLEETTGFLKVNQSRYSGVVTQSKIIVEEFSNNQWLPVKSYLYNGNLKAIYLADLAKENIFNINAFLFKRSCLSLTGLFDENLPVRGDWDFNIRFCRHFDIGVIPKPLANWHQRKNAIGSIGNTVISQKRLHQEYDAIIRNRYLRRDLNEGGLGLGLLLNYQARDYFKKKISLKNLFINYLKRFFKKH